MQNWPLLTLGIAPLLACGQAPQDGVPLRPGTEQLQTCLDDQAITQNTGKGVDARYSRAGFDRVLVLVAPNGQTLRIYAQDQVRDAQMMRAMGLLRHFLSDVPGSTWGQDKEDVANAMAASSSVLMMPNGEDGETFLSPRLGGQPLYWAETPVEGDSWYLDNDYSHRDAGFEEIFHLVHDQGIGTNTPGVRPDYQAALEAEALEALSDGRWGNGAEDWIEELSQEGSLAQEYIASVLDSSMGLWAAWDGGDGGMWGIYTAKSRSDVQELDPAGWALLNQFLSPQVHSEVRLDPSFQGRFSMSFDPELPYTHKSQYLRSVTLTGQLDADLLGNSADNTLRGNLGNNLLDGGEGQDAAVYCVPLDELLLEQQENGDWQVQGPEGTDTLRNVEWIRARDGELTL